MNTTMHKRLAHRILSLSSFVLLTLLFTACGDDKRDAIGKTEVLIETSEGDIVVRLYDDTPLHRDNFIRNVEAHLYDDIPFHRIVPDMVIQSGDPSLRGSDGKGGVCDGFPVAPPDIGATIPAEIIYPKHFHKQGALAAAREPDSINPGRRSSALQWYIVTGKKQTTAELAELQALLYEAKTATAFDRLCRAHAAEIERLKATDHAAHQELLNRLQVEAEQAMAKNPPLPYSEVQKQAYARTGGAPHLDGEYTVFGEVVDGMPIALRIGRTPVDAQEHPRRDVRIRRVTITKRSQ